MRTAYSVAKEELPFSKFNLLISLQKKNGLALTSRYANDKACAEMVTVIGKLAKEDFATEPFHHQLFFPLNCLEHQVSLALCLKFTYITVIAIFKEKDAFL